MTTRRTFLQTISAGTASIAGLTACGGGGSSTSGDNGGGGNPPPTVAGPILVVIQIQGGNDWLNLLPPLTGGSASAYRTNRPQIGIPEADLTPLNMNGTGDVGLNKNMLGMDVLHAAGKVAWIPGIGMPNPNLSHFTSTDLWGQGAAVPDGSGWLGRWGDAVFSPSEVLRGITVNSDSMLMVHGKKRDFVSIVSTGDYVYPAYLRGGALPASFDLNFLKTGFLTSLNTAAGDPAAGLASSEGKLWYDAQSTFNTLIKTRTPSVSYPGDTAYTNTRGLPRLSSQLSGQLKLVAQMIASGIPGQVYTVRLGGFDTHSNEVADYPKLMGALGGSIKAFHEDLATISTTVNGATVSAQDRVLMMGWSEFGRRIKENNGGTDHGTSVLCFCAGNMVKGGFYGGGYPDLTKPDSNGNMVSTSDFRSLYATILDRFLLGDSKSILGATYPALGFL